MKLEQIYTGCLAHAAYYLESNGEAAIFDPLREVQPYLDRAAKDHARIKFVFETHFHADFVSGHLDLAKKTGAKIVYGPTANPGFVAVIAQDYQVFRVGGVKVKAIHTPGHTMESTTYLIIDENDKERGLITGDTLFIGDVGRPDLAQHVKAELTQEKLASHLYDSLRNKIMPLSDDLILYPNHGAGSVCGKMMSKETTDTLGHQKEFNYALRPDMTKDEFIEVVLNGLTTPPQYFPKNVLMNINGYESFDAILGRANKPLKLDEFETVAGSLSALILDTRQPDEFAKGFIPGSINIGIDGSFAMWVGELISDIKQPILLVCDEGKQEESITRLSRVGYDGTIGYLEGGFKTWKEGGKPVETVERMDANAFETAYNKGEIPVYDVRRRSEFESEHVINAINIPLNELYARITEFPKDQPFILHCAGGYRSMIAASILKQYQFNAFKDVVGGYDSIKTTGVPRTKFVPQTTLL